MDKYEISISMHAKFVEVYRQAFSSCDPSDSGMQWCDILGTCQWKDRGIKVKMWEW